MPEGSESKKKMNNW